MESNFGAEISRLVDMSKLTQSEFAKRIGIDRRTLYRWMNNKNLPNVRMLNKIAKAFNLIGWNYDALNKYYHHIDI